MPKEQKYNLYDFARRVITPEQCLFYNDEDEKDFLKLYKKIIFDGPSKWENVVDSWDCSPSDWWEQNFIDELKKKLPTYYDRYANGEILYVYMRKNMKISEDFMKTIQSYVKKGSTILEFGSGHGTKYLSEYYDMISIEEDAEWVDKYPSKYLHAEVKNEWYDVDAVNMFLKDKSYDAILIDGPARGRRERILELIESNELEINTDVHIFMDDLERDADMKLAEELSTFLNRELVNYEGKTSKLNDYVLNEKYGYIIKENKND